MNYVFAALLTGVCMFGVSSVSYALDLDLGKMKEHAEEAKGQASGQTSEMNSKVENQKSEAKKEGMMGDIKAKSKEMINEKVDKTQVDMLGDK